MFFTINGVVISKEFVNLQIEPLIPAVGLKNIATQIEFNFGTKPFMFNIRGYVNEVLKDLYRYNPNSNIINLKNSDIQATN